MLAGRFDVSNWGLICARRDGAKIGGAVIACDTRVCACWAAAATGPCCGISASCQARGARASGSALVRAAAAWARARGCAWLTIETQNVNAAACHFYQQMGCTLGAIDRFAYPGLPGEVQLVWWKALTPASETESG